MKSKIISALFLSLFLGVGAVYADGDNPNTFELGTEVYYYKYTERIGVKDAGMKGGLLGAYQYQISENLPVDEWEGFFNSTNKINSIRIEGRVSYGEVDYEGSGTWDGIPDWNFETRALLGYDIPFSEDFRLTPVLGLGYRYLYNEFSVVPARTINGTRYYSGYDRESTYVYIPLGLESESRFADDWSLLLKTEVDFFVWGVQVSHFENMVDNTGSSGGYDQLENVQKRGWGWRGSARLARKTGPIDIFVEPFIRYWHINDSEWKSITAGGSETGYIGQEPDNKTWEYGINMGLNF